MLHKLEVLLDEDFAAWLKNRAEIFGWTPAAYFRRCVLDATGMPNGLVVQDKGLVLEVDALCPEADGETPEHNGEWEQIP